MQLVDPVEEAKKLQNNDPHFPRMLYRFPGSGADAVALQDGKYNVATAADEDDLARLLVDDGYFLTSTEARAAATAKDAEGKRIAGEAAQRKAVEDAKALLAAETGAPTREELEAKAAELGIKFDGRTPDKKLGEQIAAALRH